MIARNKLVDQYNNTYHYSLNKNPINAHYSALTENIQSNPKAPKFKVNDREGIKKYKNIFCEGQNEYWSRKIFIIEPVLSPWTYKIKNLDREKIIGIFMKNYCGVCYK